MAGNLEGNMFGAKPVLGSKNDDIAGNTAISLIKRILNGYGQGGFSIGFNGGFDVYSSDVRAQVEDIQDTVNDIDAAILTLTETGGTLTTDGTEQTVWTNNAPVGLFTPKKFFIDFTAQTAAETVLIREYYRIKLGGNYIEYNETSYAGLQDPDLKIHNLSDNRYGIKVTAEKTGGANKTYDWEVIYEI